MAQGNGQQQSSSAANFVWMLILVVLLSLLIWWLERPMIVRIVFLFREAEVCFMTLLFDAINAVLTAVHLGPMKDPYWYKWGEFMFSSSHKVDYSAAGWRDIVAISVSVGHWLKYFFTICSFVFLYVLLFKHSASKFARTFSMKSLRSSEASIWPTITPILNTQLVKEDVNKGPWAMAKVPLDFCKDHDLLKTKKEGTITVWAVKEEKAEGVLVKQVGSLWQGLANAPQHVQALAVIFMAKAERNGDTARNLLDQLARSATGSELDYTGVSELVAKYKDNNIMKWLEKRHAYTLTLMATLLDLSRAEGVLASAEFLWLKIKDRSLWYVLNSVGRQTAVVEVAGPIAHWVAEKKLKRALKTPMIGQAVAALSEQMANTLHVDKDDSWRTSNAD